MGYISACSESTSTFRKPSRGKSSISRSRKASRSSCWKSYRGGGQRRERSGVRCVSVSTIGYIAGWRVWLKPSLRKRAERCAMCTHAAPRRGRLTDRASSGGIHANTNWRRLPVANATTATLMPVTTLAHGTGSCSKNRLAARTSGCRKTKVLPANRECRLRSQHFGESVKKPLIYAWRDEWEYSLLIQVMFRT